MPEPDYDHTADIEVASTVISDGFPLLDPVDVEHCCEGSFTTP